MKSVAQIPESVDMNEAEDFELDLARKLDRSSPVKPSIGIWSYKNECYQYAESRLEVAAFNERELNRDIAAQLTQPESIGIPIDGRLIRYTPDALVKLLSGEFYYEEVKPASVLEDEKFLRRFEYYQAYFNNVIGFPLRINTARSDAQRPDYTTVNHQILYAALEYEIDHSLRRKLIGLVPDEPITIADVEIILEGQGLPPEMATTLIALGHFNYPNNQVLNHHSTIQVCRNEY